MPANSSFFSETKLPHQKNYGGVVFPAVLSPTAVDSGDLRAAIKEEKQWLEGLVHKHGAVLFRGFSDLTTASDFNGVVEAFGYDELPYIGSAALRKNVVGRVFTANESPPDQKISYHHEMSQLPEYPKKLFFFCEVEPASGGETPLVLSHVVYKRMKDKYPDFVDKLEKHSVIYTRVLREEDDPLSCIGLGWKSTFMTTQKSVAEERAAKLNTRLEWTDNEVKMIMGPIPAIKYDESRQRKIWFNIMVAAYIGWEDKLNDPKKTVTFGDGSPLPDHIIHDCLKILEDESVLIPWQKGDVLLIDNLAVLHARKPFTPPRRILASLCK